MSFTDTRLYLESVKCNHFSGYFWTAFWEKFWYHLAEAQSRQRGNGFTEQVNSDISLRQQNTDGLTEQFKSQFVPLDVFHNDKKKKKNMQELDSWLTLWNETVAKGIQNDQTQKTERFRSKYDFMVNINRTPRDDAFVHKHVPTCLFTNSRQTVWISSTKFC